MKIILFLLSLTCFVASPFQWEDEVPQQPKLNTQPKRQQSTPAPNPFVPTNPSQQPGISQPKPHPDPFSDPFFNGSMSIRDIHQQMRQRQEALLKQFGTFFDDPFFRSPMVGRNFSSGLTPKGKLGGRFPISGMSSSNGLEILNKKDFIVVQKQINPNNNNDYKVTLKGRNVIVTSESKQRNEETSQYGRSFSQSFSSSSESVILPQDVLADFTQRVVGDKLILVFQKK